MYTLTLDQLSNKIMKSLMGRLGMCLESQVHTVSKYVFLFAVESGTSKLQATATLAK